MHRSLIGTFVTLAMPCLFAAETPSVGPDPEAVASGKPVVPVFAAGVQLKAKGGIITTFKHSSPCLADWNNDGKKDLILGHIGEGGKGGFLRLYINSGTNAKPVFTDWQFMEADGKRIKLTGQ